MFVTDEWDGQVVPQSFTPGYVLLSFIASYAGAWTTLELLHRRTDGRGLYNWYLLIGSSISMGGVAVWSMHFIGNRALRFGDGEEHLQIAYSAGFTALSFFVPVLAFLPIFFAADAKDEVGVIRVGLGGTWVGLTICGMHYLGQLGIDNYVCSYHVRYVVASVMIAIVASSTALTIFFVLRAAWTNSYWKRALCAILLATGVSGMHWVALVGTEYHFKGTSTPSSEMLSRKNIVITAIALSLAACVILSAFAIIAHSQRHTSAVRAKQIVLACIIFDSDGRLLVSPDGLLPRQKITSAYTGESGNDLFGESHPVFLWLFRVSRNWQAIVHLIPCMRHHLHDHPSSTRAPSGAGTLSSLLAGRAPDDTADDYSVIFKESFCVAASEIADELGESFEDLGVLYDEVMNTGTTTASKLSFKRVLSKATPRLPDLEAGQLSGKSFGRGQLLCLVRRTNKAEAALLQSRGFRFTSLNHVYESLAEDLQVRQAEVMVHFGRMQNYARSERILEPGVHLACFAIRAKVGGGFDVLVRENARNQLPSKQTSVEHLEDWHRAMLQKIDGWSVSACLKSLREQATTPAELDLATELMDSITNLAEDVADPLFQEALVVAEPIAAPCRAPSGSHAPGRATLIALRLILPIHSRPSTPRLIFSPLSLFRCQQYVYANSPDHEVFARRVHREFAPIVDSTTYSTVVYRSPSQGPLPLTLSKPNPSRKTWWALTSLERRWSGACESESSSEKTSSGAGDRQSWGGILVSEEVNINVEEPLGPGAVKMEDVTSVSADGGASAVAPGDREFEDSDCFVDRLFAICAGRR